MMLENQNNPDYVSDDDYESEQERIKSKYDYECGHK